MAKKTPPKKATTSTNRSQSKPNLRRPSKDGTQRGRQAGTTIPSSGRRSVRALVDKFCGPDSSKIIHAYAVLALGNAQSRANFFGESVKLDAKARIAALNQLALRRWGRVPMTMELDPDSPDTLPIQIVNVFTAEMDPSDE